MCHRATNWAIQQRGLEPATKILLWQLAYRRNAHTGRCDPSQERLAHDCEMSRATVNRHLKKLELAGLIQRVQRINPKTRRQANTSYRLAFDTKFPVSQSDARAVSQMEQEPCLKSDNNRVSNCDSNPVSEPEIKPVFSANTAQHTHPAFDEFWEAHPRAVKREATSAAFADAVAAGADPEEIIAAARAYAVEQAGNKTQFVKTAPRWISEMRWLDHASKTTTKVDPLTAATIKAKYAKAILNNHASLARHCPVSTAHELIEANEVTAEKCRDLGIPV